VSGPYQRDASQPGYGPADESAAYADAGVGSTAYGDAGVGSTSYEGAGSSSAAGSPPDVEDQSVGSIVGRLSTHLSQLMSQEIALAKAELRGEVQKAGKGAGMLAGAGFAALMVAIFASITLMWLLDNVMDVTWGALIVTLLWLVVGAILYVIGRNQLKQVNPKPEQTVESLKEDKEWLKAQKN
jgi:uncharacterized membrane protein YqjE